MRSQWGYLALLPLFASLVWIGMLMGMLIYWCTSGRPHYPSMEDHQKIPYISDVGAFRLKPLFISASAVMVVSFNLSFLSERWLRHNGRLAPNTGFQKTASLLSIFFAIVGAVGLIILTIFDTYRHNRVHHVCLGLFIGGYVVSAILVCIEYQRLGVHYRQFRILRLSFWTKLGFIVVEVALAIVFAVYSSTSSHSRRNGRANSAARKRDVAAAVEWSVAFVFTLYVLSYLIDLLPAIQSRNHPPQGLVQMNGGGTISPPENDAEQGQVRGGYGGADEKAAAHSQTRTGFLGWLGRARRGWPGFSG